MSERELHHCAACDAVFPALSPLAKDARCPECGKSPFVGLDFRPMVEADQRREEKSSHGVPGKDVADFVSMQKVRRKRQGRMAIAVWVGVLLLGVGLTVYSQQKKLAEPKEDSAIVKEQKEYKKKLQKEGAKCLTIYGKFVDEVSVEAKSNYVLGGVSMILKMQREEGNLDRLIVKKPLRVVASKYVEAGDVPRMEFLMHDVRGMPFESVFWKVDGAWKLDWEQQSRYAVWSWDAFLLMKVVGKPASFPLYVRRRHVASSKESDKMQLLFYRAKAQAGERGEESPQVNIDTSHVAFTLLEEGFQAAESEGDTKKVVGRMDKPRLLRVRAKLQWHTVDGGEPELRLESVEALHWLAFDPEVEK